jgi:hypothetical protein
MERFLQKVFTEPFQGFLQKVAEFLPNLITSLVLILAGFVVAWLLSLAVGQALRLLRVDTLAERAGVRQALQRGGIKDSVSALLGRLTYWITLISFLIMGLNALQVPAVEGLMSRFFLYLPNLVMAVVLLVFGYLMGNFLGRAALIAAVNAGLRGSQAIAGGVKIGVFIVAVTMALELLGIGKDTVLVAFAVLFGGVVLALAIAFGLGGQELARRYLERLRQKEEDRDELKHL